MLRVSRSFLEEIMYFCVLLHIISPNMVALNNKLLLSYIVSEGQETWHGLVGRFWLGVSWGCSHVCQGFQDGSLSWLLARSLSFLPWESLHRATHNMVANLSQSEGPKRERGKSQSVFYNLESGVVFHHFPHILLIIQVNPDTRLSKGVNTRRQGSLGATLETGSTDTA